MYPVRCESKLHRIRDITFSTCGTVCGERSNFLGLMCQEMEKKKNVIQRLSRQYLTNGNIWKEAKSNTPGLHSTQISILRDIRARANTHATKFSVSYLLPETYFWSSFHTTMQATPTSQFYFFIPSWF